MRRTAACDDPLTGRFLSPDTIDPQYNEPQSLNRFSYAYDSPLRYTDPTGRCGYDVGHVDLTNLLGFCTAPVEDIAVRHSGGTPIPSYMVTPPPCAVYCGLNFPLTSPTETPTPVWNHCPYNMFVCPTPTPTATFTWQQQLHYWVQHRQHALLWQEILPYAARAQFAEALRLTSNIAGFSCRVICGAAIGLSVEIAYMLANPDIVIAPGITPTVSPSPPY